MLPASARVIFADGDSTICQLINVPGLRNAFFKATPLLNTASQFYSFGVSGASVGTGGGQLNNTTRRNNINSKISGLTGPTEKFILLRGGTNNIDSLASGSIVGNGTAVVLPLVEAWFNWWLNTASSNPTVIVSTCIPRTSAGFNGSATDKSQKVTEQAALNDGIIAWATANSVVCMQAHTITDVGTLGDGTHFNETGYGLEAAMLADLMNTNYP